MSLSVKDKKYLRGLAHHLEPVIRVGKEGVSVAIVASLEEVLLAHELVKLKFVEHKEFKQELAGELARETGAEIVGEIGNIIIFYRPHPDKHERKIRLGGS